MAKHLDYTQNPPGGDVSGERADDPKGVKNQLKS
jgi:hypothetical protein